MGMFPTKQKWKGWSLPSKAGYLGCWLAVLGIVLSIVIAFVLNGTHRPLPPSPAALASETQDNFKVLAEKILVADHVYKILLESERKPSLLIAPNPYRDLGSRLNRDLPRFRLQYLPQVRDPLISVREPYATYSKICGLFETIELNEQRIIQVMNMTWDTYEHMGLGGSIGIGAYRHVLQTLLARNYISTWGLLLGFTEQVQIKISTVLPQNLQITSDIIDKREEERRHDVR